MKQLLELTRRDLKVFFKDKGMFISSLITPIILLVLYATFLARVYKDSFDVYVVSIHEIWLSVIESLDCLICLAACICRFSANYLVLTVGFVPYRYKLKRVFAGGLDQCGKLSFSFM